MGKVKETLDDIRSQIQSPHCLCAAVAAKKTDDKDEDLRRAIETMQLKLDALIVKPDDNIVESSKQSGNTIKTVLVEKGTSPVQELYTADSIVFVERGSSPIEDLACYYNKESLIPSDSNKEEEDQKIDKIIMGTVDLKEEALEKLEEKEATNNESNILRDELKLDRLAVQIMPLIDIQRSLKVQKLLNVDIPSVSNFDEFHENETNPNNNVSYEVIKKISSLDSISAKVVESKELSEESNFKALSLATVPHQLVSIKFSTDDVQPSDLAEVDVGDNLITIVEDTEISDTNFDIIEENQDRNVSQGFNINPINISWPKLTSDDKEEEKSVSRTEFCSSINDSNSKLKEELPSSLGNVIKSTDGNNSHLIAVDKIDLYASKSVQCDLTCTAVKDGLVSDSLTKNASTGSDNLSELSRKSKEGFNEFSAKKMEENLHQMIKNPIQSHQNDDGLEEELHLKDANKLFKDISPSALTPPVPDEYCGRLCSNIRSLQENKANNTIITKNDSLIQIIDKSSSPKSQISNLEADDVDDLKSSSSYSSTSKPFRDYHHSNKLISRPCSTTNKQNNRLSHCVFSRNSKLQTSLSSSISLDDDESKSEGEMRCKCCVSNGEIHSCKNNQRNVNRIRQHVAEARKRPLNLLRHELHDTSLTIARQRTYYDNWVAYYVSKSNQIGINDSSCNTTSSNH